MKRSREPEQEAPTTDSAATYGDETGSTASAPPPAVDLPAPKITGLDESAIDDTPSPIAMRCSLPGHKEPLSFRSYAEYEAHYNKAHTNRCNECRKNFPSEHILNVHIEECHDAFAAVLREKGEHTYSCFVEGCDRKCGTPQKRRMHLIDKHMYPKHYFFAVSKEGIDGRSSLLLEGGHHRRRSSASQAGGSYAGARRHSLRQPDTAQASLEERGHPSKQSPEEEAPHDTPGNKESVDTEMADLASAMSSLQFVPTSVRFGRGRGRAGFSRT
ncbi:hypothetical protein JX265_002429 [Neoarthrinium moseri]|uniref:C2H2-type domain-containing protein n=1 Tax=Neoarthrinium moseri TaxID=1658444 RepID=A0A9P9WUX4_9PEZI|nr:uncharacterized protein JN550_000243 [Neoarthrinium moseri]KAI1854790.1 hypothetical protein JX266_000908 [Neoarthrinium moseri]KAI1878061.1 hypothetical protein JN550_000243 [Neoarthrinium moseri]KAI1879475.1 hypothetical protein JX265_002429 [Neoarthrinium moseri]